MTRSTRVCSIEGCNASIRARGWCSKHWQRWRANGDPTKAAGRSPRVVVERTCQLCGVLLNITTYRLHAGRGRYCSVACRSAAKVTRVQRVCEQCGRLFTATPYRIALGRGRYCSSGCAAVYVASVTRGTARVPLRPGDKSQARRLVRTSVQRGDRPHPNTLPCTDCGHAWQSGERRHEYDHYLGYDANHYDVVEPVCPPCHLARTVARGEPVSGSRLNPERMPRGKTHPNAKLTADAVLSIRAEHATGTSTRQLARTYGVSQAAVCAVLSRRVWRHV